MGFVANFIRFPALQKFWKSVKIWQSYKELKGGYFLRHSVYCILYFSSKAIENCNDYKNKFNSIVFYNVITSEKISIQQHVCRLVKHFYVLIVQLIINNFGKNTYYIHYVNRGRNISEKFTSSAKTPDKLGNASFSLYQQNISRELIG